MAAFAVMGALPLSRQEVCGGDHRNPPLKNLGSGEYCVKGGSSNSKGCDGYLATGNFSQVKSVVNASGSCGLSHWSFDGDDEETPRPTRTHEPKPSKTPDPTAPRPTSTLDPEPSETPVPPTKTPRPSKTPKPSATPDPTFTSEPTETPIPPTDTPRPDPTDTPKPDPTNTSKPPPTPTDQEPKASATLPSPTVTLTASPQLTATETPLASETPYVCVVCCVCGSQTPIVVEVIAEAPDLSPIAEELKPIFYVLVGIFAMLGGSLILGVYNSIKK